MLATLAILRVSHLLMLWEFSTSVKVVRSLLRDHLAASSPGPEGLFGLSPTIDEAGSNSAVNAPSRDALDINQSDDPNDFLPRDLEDIYKIEWMPLDESAVSLHPVGTNNHVYPTSLPPNSRRHGPQLPAIQDVHLSSRARRTNELGTPNTNSGIRTKHHVFSSALPRAIPIYVNNLIPPTGRSASAHDAQIIPRYQPLRTLQPLQEGAYSTMSVGPSSNLIIPSAHQNGEQVAGLSNQIQSNYQAAGYSNVPHWPQHAQHNGFMMSQWQPSAGRAQLNDWGAAPASGLPPLPPNRRRKPTQNHDESKILTHLVSPKTDKPASINHIAKHTENAKKDSKNHDVPNLRPIRAQRENDGKDYAESAKYSSDRDNLRTSENDFQPTDSTGGKKNDIEDEPSSETSEASDSQIPSTSDEHPSQRSAREASPQQISIPILLTKNKLRDIELQYQVTSFASRDKNSNARGVQTSPGSKIDADNNRPHVLIHDESASLRGEGISPLRSVAIPADQNKWKDKKTKHQSNTSPPQKMTSNKLGAEVSSQSEKALKKQIRQASMGHKTPTVQSKFETSSLEQNDSRKNKVVEPQVIGTLSMEKLSELEKDIAELLALQDNKEDNKETSSNVSKAAARNKDKPRQEKNKEKPMLIDKNSDSFDPPQYSQITIEKNRESRMDEKNNFLDETAAEMIKKLRLTTRRKENVTPSDSRGEIETAPKTAIELSHPYKAKESSIPEASTPEKITETQADSPVMTSPHGGKVSVRETISEEGNCKADSQPTREIATAKKPQSQVEETPIVNRLIIQSKPKCYIFPLADRAKSGEMQPRTIFQNTSHLQNKSSHYPTKYKVNYDLQAEELSRTFQKMKKDSGILNSQATQTSQVNIMTSLKVKKFLPETKDLFVPPHCGSVPVGQNEVDPFGTVDESEMEKSWGEETVSLWKSKKLNLQLMNSLAFDLNLDTKNDNHGISTAMVPFVYGELKRLANKDQAKFRKIEDSIKQVLGDEEGSRRLNAYRRALYYHTLKKSWESSEDSLDPGQLKILENIFGLPIQSQFNPKIISSPPRWGFVQRSMDSSFKTDENWRLVVKQLGEREGDKQWAVLQYVFQRDYLRYWWGSLDLPSASEFYGVDILKILKIGDALRFGCYSFLDDLLGPVDIDTSYAKILPILNSYEIFPWIESPERAWLYKVCGRLYQDRLRELSNLVISRISTLANPLSREELLRLISAETLPPGYVFGTELIWCDLGLDIKHLVNFFKLHNPPLNGADSFAKTVNKLGEYQKAAISVWLRSTDFAFYRPQPSFKRWQGLLQTLKKWKNVMKDHNLIIQ